jgi:hypothetical protein
MAPPGSLSKMVVIPRTASQQIMLVELGGSYLQRQCLDLEPSIRERAVAVRSRCCGVPQLHTHMAHANAKYRHSSSYQCQFAFWGLKLELRRKYTAEAAIAMRRILHSALPSCCLRLAVVRLHNSTITISTNATAIGH